MWKTSLGKGHLDRDKLGKIQDYFLILKELPDYLEADLDISLMGSPANLGKIRYMFVFAEGWTWCLHSKVHPLQLNKASGLFLRAIASAAKIGVWWIEGSASWTDFEQAYGKMRRYYNGWVRREKVTLKSDNVMPLFETRDDWDEDEDEWDE